MAKIKPSILIKKIYHITRNLVIAKTDKFDNYESNGPNSRHLNTEMTGKKRWKFSYRI